MHPVGMEIDGHMVMQICQQHGWRVPQDVAIITGYNEEHLCEHVRPTLTSIEVGYDRIGYEAAKLLDRMIDRGRRKRKSKPAPPEQIILPPQGLIVRESTDFLMVDDPLIGKALTFIAENAHRKIRVEHVAQAVFLEKRSLELRFRKYLDRSVYQEIVRVRLERAKRELEQTDGSLSEIARGAGFGSRARMYDVFLRELGVTPSDYRKQRQVTD